MKTIYTVTIQYVFGGIEKVHTFFTEEKADAFILEWANENIPEDPNDVSSFTNAYDALEWFRKNDEKATYTIQKTESCYGSDVLESFTVEELMSEISKRAIEAKVVTYASSLWLMSLESAKWDVKQSLHNCNGVDIGDDNYYIDPTHFEGESPLDDLVQRANDFGIGLINVY